MNLADLVLGAACLTLLMVIVGVMRETVILRGDVKALAQLITKPPVPSFIGSLLPAALAEKLGLLPDLNGTLHRTHVILFLGGGCTGCEQLLWAMQDEIRSGGISTEDISCVVADRSENISLLEAARAVSRKVIFDANGRLMRSCEIRGTPSQLAISAGNLEVFDYILGGDVEWIQQRLQNSQARATTMMASK